MSVALASADRPRHRMWPRALLAGGVIALLYAVAMVLANVSCPSWFGRPDALLGLAASGFGAIVLLATALAGASAARRSVPIACAFLAGVSIVPSLPIVLAIGYFALGMSAPVGRGRDRFIRFAFMAVVTFVVFALDHAIVPIGDAGRCV